MTAEEGRLSANGLNFRYLAAGPAGARLYLLLHGFPEGAESWLPQLTALAEAGFRAVAPDLRGYGGSDAPERVDQYALGPLVQDVAAIADALGAGKFHLAGHDWGSVIGWVFAGTHPDRALSYAALSVPHPEPFRRAMREDPEQHQKSWYIGFFRDGSRAEESLSRDGMKALRNMYEGKLPDEVVVKYLYGFARPGRLTAALNYYRAPVQSDGAGLPITVPTVLIWGDQDVAIGKQAVSETERHVKAPYRLAVLEGAGHWLQYERPHEVSSLLVEQASLS